MSFRPRSMLLAGLAAAIANQGMVPSAQMVSDHSIPVSINAGRGRYYIVDTRRERHTKHPRMVRHTSRTKSRKRNRNKIKRRSHGG